MSLPHLTDEQIQEYLDGQVSDRDAIRIHLESCELCRDTVKGYRALYHALESQPVAEIMSAKTVVNLYRDVRSQKQSSSFWENVLIVASILVSVAISFYFFNPLPLLNRVGSTLIGTVTGFTDTISPHLTKTLPILLVAVIILLLFDFADKRFIRSSIVKGK
jgi:hypothetical protein